MKNFVEHGEVMPILAPTGGVVSGDLTIQGIIFGVAATTAAEGERVNLKLGGVYNLPAATSQAWTQGAALYWDNTNKVATTTASGNTKIGAAFAAKLAADASGRVYLNRSF